jgi:hypothetical protein
MSNAKQSPARAKLVICLDGDVLTAADLSGRGDEPKKSVSERLGRSIKRTDARAVGHHLKEVLERSGVPRGKAIYAATRSDVVVKHLAIPGAATMRDDHLDQAVKLQIKRQLSMPADEAFIDYVLVPSDNDDRPVLVAAMPEDRVNWLRDMCDAAGVELAGIGLRPAALAARIDATHTTMMVWVGPSSVEYVVSRGGRLVFARGVDLGATNDDNLPERVRVEASRTLMSYRVQSGLPAVELIHLAGRRCRGLAARFLKDHGVPVTHEYPETDDPAPSATDSGPKLDPNADPLGRQVEAEIFGGPDPQDASAEEATTVTKRPEQDEQSVVDESAEAAVWALGAIRRAMEIDFLSPTVPRDHASRRRQVLLGVVGMLLVGGMGLFFLADREINDLKAERAALDEELSDLSGRYAAYLLDAARLQHIRTWDEQQAAWTDHLGELVAMMPDRDHARLNSLSARATSGVRYSGAASTASLDAPEAWTGAGTVTLSFDATIPDRDQATAFRARVIDGGVYEVGTKGADEPGRVSWSFLTRELKLPASAVTAIDQSDSAEQQGATGGAS